MSTCLFRGRSTPAIRAMCYPCLCLCFEFSQITRTTPLRCTILHLSQIFFTDARTFMLPASFLYGTGALACASLLVPVHDSAPRQVVRRKLHRDLVPGKNADEILAHSAGYVREHLMFIF